MNIIWNGHSCFTLDTAQGCLVLDPYQDESVPGLAPLRLTADQVLCSHDHRDHGAVELVTLSGRSCTIGVETLSTFHDDTQGSQRGLDTIHILSAEGLRVAHLGDLGCPLTPEQIQALQGLDALLIPVGGYYTIDAAQAQAVVAQLSPRVVIPMHYRGDTFGYDVIGRREDFLAQRTDVIFYPSNELELTSQTPAQTAVLTCPTPK